MMSTPAAAQLEALQGHYQLHFVDRPRVSRSLDMLRKLEEGALGLSAATDSQLRQQAKRFVALLQREANEIARAQAAAGNAGRLEVELAEEGERLLRRVRRLGVLHPTPGAARPHQLAVHLGELEDFLARLQAAAADMGGALGPALKTLQQALSHAAQHLGALRGQALAQRQAPASQGAQAAPSPRLQAAVLAARATLADLAHTVSGRTSLVVRPGYLDMLLTDLKEAHEIFVAHGDEAGANTPDFHAQNAQALADQVALWQKEQRQVVAKRRQYTADELAHAIAQEADAIMDAAEAQEAPGARVSVAERGYLCLRMDELHRQLLGIPLLFGHAQHHETLAGLADCLAWLERDGTAATPGGGRA